MSTFAFYLGSGRINGEYGFNYREFGTTTETQNYTYLDKNLRSGNYSYKLIQIDYDGKRNESNVVKVEITAELSEFRLEQNYPNPFNPSTNINYTIPEDNFVELKIFNAIGEEIVELVSETQNAGSYDISFNATDLSGGIYFYRLKAGNFSQVRKMMLVK